MSELRSVHESIQAGVDLSALVYGTDNFSIEEETLKLEDIVLHAKIFRSFKRADIEKVFLFAATAGNFEYDRDPMFDVYADLWGTAYVDALLELLVQEIQRVEPPSEGFNLTRPFGPGFYGMPLSEVKTFFEALPIQKIGITLRGTLMIPLKSYVGLIFSLRSGLRLGTCDCWDCIGSADGCAYCRNNPAIRPRGGSNV